MTVLSTTITLFISSLLIASVVSKTAQEWKSRSVYQIITDRFARTNGDSTPCGDLNNYCGGTFKGIQNNLDYIQGMGFDAIWISPIVANTPGGYHGYWTSDLYKVNENFGTAEELKELVQICHQKDIWVMVDVVGNHMGYVNNWDYSNMVPFNDASHYNQYSDCAHVASWDQQAIETCWLSGLPDLDQNNPFVRKTLVEWARDFVQTYDIDALRIDTVPHVSKSFWAEFSRAAGVYTIGEILSFDIHYLAGYQGSVDAVLNYALYSTLRYAFQTGGSMDSIRSYYEGAASTWADITVLGNFVNNHDNPRFLSGSSNHQAFKNALGFTIASVGIPMVYYGDEQAFGGGMDPANREALWTNMNTESEIYGFLRTLNNFRKNTRFFEFEQIQRYSDNTFYAFTRGDYFFAFTNTHDYQGKSVTYHPYADGTVLCNILFEGDCVEVKDGSFPVVLLNGEMKVFAPRITNAEPISEASNGWKDAVQAFTSIPMLKSVGSYFSSGSSA